MNYDPNEKISKFLRSAFRMRRMEVSFAPQQLLMLEKSIFADRLKDLNPEEVYAAMMIWHQYCEESAVQEELDDHHIMTHVNSEIMNLN